MKKKTIAIIFVSTFALMSILIMAIIIYKMSIKDIVTDINTTISNEN